MTSLLPRIERDLGTTIEGAFSVPVVLVSPDGERIEKTADGRPLCGFVRWTRKETSPEGGEPIVVHAPVVTLRLSSLSRVPATGEKWFVQIPECLRMGAPMADYLLDVSAAVEAGRSLGTVTLPLSACEIDSIVTMAEEGELENGWAK